MKIQKNISLSRYSTFRIGGPAKYFCAVSALQDLNNVISWSQNHKLRYFILGGGSNVLFPDIGFDGLVIKTNFTNFSVSGDIVEVSAGITLAECIAKTLDAGLVGMEFAAGIPGTIGGAIRGNAGTYGKGISGVTIDVSILDEKTLRQRIVTNQECLFSYRHSTFKEHNHIIISARLQLRHGDVIESKKTIHERIALRRTEHPHGPSAGCIFKNVEFAKVNPDLLRSQGLDIVQFGKFQKIPTGYLIEQVGLKGKTIGGAEISSQHANYIINKGSATFEDVVTLISLIKQKIRDTYGIQLDEEVQIVS